MRALFCIPTPVHHAGPRPSASIHQPIHRHSEACRWAPFTGNPASRFLMEWGTNQIQTSTIRCPARKRTSAISNQKSPHQRAAEIPSTARSRTADECRRQDQDIRHPDQSVVVQIFGAALRIRRRGTSRIPDCTGPRDQPVYKVHRIHRVHRFFTILTSPEADHRQSGERERGGLTVESAQSIGNATGFRTPSEKAQSGPDRNLYSNGPSP